MPDKTLAVGFWRIYTCQDCHARVEAPVNYYGQPLETVHTCRRCLSCNITASEPTEERQL